MRRECRAAATHRGGSGGSSPQAVRAERTRDRGLPLSGLGHAGHAYSADPYVSRYPLVHARERMIMNLNDLMEVDHVIAVHHDGTVTDGPSWLYAPNLLDEKLDSPQWSMLSGYSGQDRYSGPVMHDSEYIGGGLARHILEIPGHYVAVVAYWSDGDDDESDYAIEGWAVARYCGHVWIAGMMYVHEEDLGAVASVRRVECERCEYVPVAGRDY